MSEGARILSARTLMTWASGPSDKFINHPAPWTVPTHPTFDFLSPSGVHMRAPIGGGICEAARSRGFRPSCACSELLPSQWRVAAKRGAPRRQTATIHRSSAVTATGLSESCLVLQRTPWIRAVDGRWDRVSSCLWPSGRWLSCPGDWTCACRSSPDGRVSMSDRAHSKRTYIFRQSHCLKDRHTDHERTHTTLTT